MSDYVRSVTVHWNDCDPTRIVSRSHYIQWMDEGFHEMARARGVDYTALQSADPSFRASPLVNVSDGELAAVEQDRKAVERLLEARP